MIVGQGIAGSLLAMELDNKDCEVTIVNSSSIPSSSSVAAGLFNPVVFKRLLPSWKADILIPFLLNHYQELEKQLSASFLHYVEIAKVMDSEEEQRFWEKKAQSDLLNMVSGKTEEIHIEGTIKKVNIGTVFSSGYVDLNVFLAEVKKHLSKRQSYISENFDFNVLKTENNNVFYKGVKYDRVIFCEGYNIRQNPYFSFIPFKPVNGDVLTLKFKDYHYLKNLNKNFFLLPTVEGTYRLGATYDWNNLVFTPNEKAKESLLSKVKEFISETPQIVEHKAGVRPSTNDRRPVVGAHPIYKSFYVFNGMGTKGVMIAPYLATELVNHLLIDTAIDPEVSVERFYYLQK